MVRFGAGCEKRGRPRPEPGAQTTFPLNPCPEEPDVVAAGQFLETFADIWVEAIPKERKELLGLLLEEVLVDVAEDRIVCVRPKASFVALFQQVADLEEQDGCFHLASNGGL